MTAKDGEKFSGHHLEGGRLTRAKASLVAMNADLTKSLSTGHEYGEGELALRDQRPKETTAQMLSLEDEF